jgi:hypothetical protein
MPATGPPSGARRLPIFEYEPYSLRPPTPGWSNVTPRLNAVSPAGGAHEGLDGIRFLGFTTGPATLNRDEREDLARFRQRATDIYFTPEPFLIRHPVSLRVMINDSEAVFQTATV